MKKLTVRDLTAAALIAAMYAVMGIFGNVFGLTFGPVQVRFAEALTVLPFLFPSVGYGVVLGCLITNILSPYGAVDMIFGTLATAIAAILTAKAKKAYLAPLPPIIINVLILPAVWAWMQAGVSEAFLSLYAYNAAVLLPGQIVACYLLGGILLKTVPKLNLNI